MQQCPHKVKSVVSLTQSYYKQEPTNSDNHRQTKISLNVFAHM